jgi:hypothetical protein
MKDYAQYTSRIPSPGKRGATTTTVTTKNVAHHPLSTKSNQRPSGGGEGPESISTASLSSIQSSSPQHQQQQQNQVPQQRQPQHSLSSSAPNTPAASQTTTRGSQPQQRSVSQSPSAKSSSAPSPASQNSPNRSSGQADNNNTNVNYRSIGSSNHATHNDSTTLTASDALAIRRDGTEVTVARLRNALDEANSKDTTAKAALAKSDAVILELRSTVGQVKRQLEAVQKEKQDWKERHDKVLANLKQVQQEAHQSSQSQLKHYQQQIQQLQQQLAMDTSQAKDAKVGELQVQLDRAHAQILTADMVRKELEDTLEAEQYTWELRVQDQERSIAQMQLESETLAEDLETCRSQWKEAEVGWNDQVESLQQQLTQARTRMAATAASAATTSQDQREILDKVAQLEQERAELQNCLDEALQELEAVDAELGSDGGVKDRSGGGSSSNTLVEPLQHLLRWIVQEGSDGDNNGADDVHSMSSDAKVLLQQIQERLEKVLGDLGNRNQNGGNSQQFQQQLAELQNQVNVYKKELVSREESSVELRESLKEAVALLKPLQDAVAKAEVEKSELQTKLQSLERSRSNESKVEAQLAQRNQKIQALEEHITSLEQQMEEHKHLAQARQSLLEATVSPLKSPASSRGIVSSDDSLTKIQKAREELRRKRESEGNLKQLLRDAQTRFHSLHQQNEEVATKNRELQGQLKHAEQRLVVQTGEDSSSQLQNESMNSVDRTREDLAQRDKEIASLREQLEVARSSVTPSSNNQLRRMDEELGQMRTELAQKEQTERILNKSLKEALSLLKPLQMHLEDAEKEKMEISKELRNLRKRFRQLQMGDHSDDQSRSTMGPQDVSIELIKVKEELEETVRQLELENSQLHDALEELSSEGGAVNNGMKGSNKKSSDAKLRQKIVEMNSRYEVTQNKLEDAHIENHALVKALKQKDLDDKRRNEELRVLREKYERSEAELHNAKSIARSALVKVEELTMANVEQLSLSQEGQLEMLRM